MEEGGVDPMPVAYSNLILLLSKDALIFLGLVSTNDLAQVPGHPLWIMSHMVG